MTRQPRAEETRKRILEIAAACFARNGYSATSIAEICEQAGVSKGAFYHHFAGKQAVFMALLDAWMSELESALSSLASDSETVPERLSKMAGMMRVIFDYENARIPMFLEFWTQASRDESVWQATIAPYRKYRAFFSALLQQGIEEGSLQPIDPDTGAQLIISLASGLLLQGLLDPEGADWGQLSEDSIRMLLDRLKRR